MTLGRVVLALFAFSLCAAPAKAEDYLTASAGYFDILRQKDTSALFGLEYRFDPVKWDIRPMVGGFVTTDGSAYGYAGLALDLKVLDQLYVVPNFAPGLYSTGNGKFLGGPVSFRTGIEFDYQFQNTQRLGIAFNHMSNADIYNHNPSDENLIVTYSIPVRTIVHWAGL